MEVDEASAKMSSGPPDGGDSEDAALDMWAGEVSIVQSVRRPVPSPAEGIAIAETAWAA
jgi:uncharacterized protein